MRTRKPTNREIQERVELVADMVARLGKRGEIHRACAEKWGVCWRSADRYVSRAREVLRQRAGISREEAREMGISLLFGLIRSGSPRIALMAEARLAEIFGYNAPRQHELTGRNGRALEIAPLSPEERRQRLNLIFGRLPDWTPSGNDSVAANALSPAKAAT